MDDQQQSSLFGFANTNKTILVFRMLIKKCKKEWFGKDSCRFSERNFMFTGI